MFILDHLIKNESSAEKGMGRSAAIPARYRRYAKGLATRRAMSRPKCSIVGHHGEIALPDDPPEFKPTGLTRADLVSNVMRDLVAREALSGIAPSEAELQSSLQRTMRFATGDVWIFAYGSLIWNPIFPFAERRVARVFGYRRSFCLRSIVGRGSVEKPGLMLALDTGGTAIGVAFRLPPAAVDQEMPLLWRREMTVGSYAAKWLRAKTTDGDIRVLAFVANKRAANYVQGLSEAESARMIASASGFLGSNLEYLVRTHAGPSEHGIKDTLLARLARRCAQATTPPSS